MDLKRYWQPELPFPKKKDFNDFVPYWNSVWFIFAVGFGGRALEPLIGYRAIGFLFLLAVLVVGFFGRLGPVLFAALVSWLSWNFFFIPPRYTLAISEPEDVLMCLTYFLVAIATGLLASRVKQQEFVIRERQERTNLLYEVMLDITANERRNEFLLKITERLSRVLNGKCDISLKSKAGSSSVLDLNFSFKASEREREAAEAAFRTGKLTGWSADQFDDANALYVPIKGNNETVGVFRYEPDQPILLTLDQENLLQSICRQIGISLEQRYVDERLRDTERLRESEKMHQTLLNSISHELRTPLTAIIGSASALEDESALKSEASRKLLAHEIKISGERLNRVVENLLDMSRLSAGGFAVKKEWHDLNDLIGVAIGRIEPSLEGRKIKTAIEAELPLVEIDFRLLEHALYNIVSNAISYSPLGSEILLSAIKLNESVEITVEDQGHGIPEQYHSLIFEKFYRVPGSPPGGTGLGLSIAKSIVEFHSGTIKASHSPRGGARISISLPLNPNSPRFQ